MVHLMLDQNIVLPVKRSYRCLFWTSKYAWYRTNFKVSRQTLAAWLVELGEKEEFKDLNASLNDVPQNDTLELDLASPMSYVVLSKKKNKNGSGQQ